MRQILTAAVCASLMLAAAPAHAESVAAPRGTLVIIGDSLASSSSQSAWHHRVAATHGMTLHKTSGAGSGIIKAGNHCASPSFTARLGEVDTHRPDAVIIEDAVNDRYFCRYGKPTRATNTQVKSLTDRFMRELAIRVQRIGLARKEVYIFMPSAHKSRGYNWTRDLAKTAARRHGFTFVEPVYLTVHQTTDGIHPNQRGHDQLATIMIDALTPRG